MHDLVIVILNYNTRALLKDCLASLRVQEGPDTAVCVVDNASSDESADMVRAEFPEVRLIVNPENIGFPAGNNAGLRAFGFPDGGQARYAMLLNPDTRMPPGAIQGLVDFADRTPDAGVIGPKLILQDGTLDRACRRSFPTPEVSFYRMVGLSRLFPRSKRFGRYNLTFLDENAQADVDSVVGACMLVRREAIASAGLLDERYFMYGEDLDWCLRIKQATGANGTPYRVVYFPGVIVHHIKRAASRLSPKAQFEFNRAMWLFYAKHYRAATGWAMDLIVRAGLALRGGPRLLAEIRRPVAGQ